VFAIADEDLERENAEKTSAVHFLRFELSAGMIAAAKGGAAISVGVDHPEYDRQHRRPAGSGQGVAGRRPALTEKLCLRLSRRRYPLRTAPAGRRLLLIPGGPRLTALPPRRARACIPLF
jgi:hypothetical protein